MNMRTCIFSMGCAGCGNQNEGMDLLMTSKDTNFTEIFERGSENTAFAEYFTGQSYLNMLTKFVHLAVEVPGEEANCEWCESVSDEEYGKLK